MLVASFLFVSSASGQAEPNRSGDANFEVILHVLVGTTKSDVGDPLPAGLSNVARQLRSDFGVQNTRVLQTFLGRLGNGGSLDYKGVSGTFAQDPIPGSPSFLEWRLMDLRKAASDGGAAIYQLQAIYFGGRVPVGAGSSNEAGKSSGAINYEMVGLSLQRLVVAEATPTLIGTLGQPNSTSTIYLVLTVRNVE